MYVKFYDWLLYVRHRVELIIFQSPQIGMSQEIVIDLLCPSPINSYVCSLLFFKWFRLKANIDDKSHFSVFVYYSWNQNK